MDRHIAPDQSQRGTPCSERVCTVVARIDFQRLERQKHVLYSLLQTLGVAEPDGNGGHSDPRQELWALVDLCEDLLDAAEAEGLRRE